MVRARHRKHPVIFPALLKRITDGFVTMYRKNAPPGSLRWIDYGLLCFRRRCFDDVRTDSPQDLGTLVRELIDRRTLRAFVAVERFWEIGTPEALRNTEKHFEQVRMWEQLQ